jgi:hypothetical protein
MAGSSIRKFYPRRTDQKQRSGSLEVDNLLAEVQGFFAAGTATNERGAVIIWASGLALLNFGWKRCGETAEQTDYTLRRMRMGHS